MSKIELQKGGRVVRVHPKLADVLVARGGYLRRDMVAQTVTVDLDSENQPWSAELHTAGKTKTAAGTWRKKPGAKQ